MRILNFLLSLSFALEKSCQSEIFFPPLVTGEMILLEGYIFLF